MFQKEQTVLMVIDIQGKLADMMYDRDRLFSSAATLVRGMKLMDIPIIWMEQLPDKLGPTIAPISGLLAPDYSPISKHNFSCCREPDVMTALEGMGRQQVLLSGIESHICVYQTGVDLISRGYEVQVVTDAVSSRTAENRQLGIDGICRAGGGATGVEMIFFELLKAAGGDLFRQVVKLIK